MGGYHAAKRVLKDIFHLDIANKKKYEKIK